MTTGGINTKHPLIEVLRLISAFSIVWFHSEATFGHELSYSGLIIFVFLSAYYAGASKKTRIDLNSKVIRFFWPWLFWSVVYGIGYILVGRPFFKYQGDVSSQLLIGNSIHLWYLPFIFFVLVSLDIFKSLFGYLRVGMAFYIGALLYFFYAGSWRALSLDLPAPLPQYCHALGGVLLGFYWGALNRETHSHELNWLDWLALLAVMVSIFLSIGVAGFGLPYLVGIVLVVAFLVVKTDQNVFPGVRNFSDCTYGIYLVHPFFLHLFSINKLGYLGPVIVFCLSFVVVYYFRRFMPVFSRYVT